MDAAVAGLAGAAIGALSGLFTAVVTGWNQRRSDRQRWQQTRIDELWKEERRALLELTSLLAQGSQAASWLAWSASVKPAESVLQEASDYEHRMRELLPKLFSAQAAASGLSDAAFAEINPLVQRLAAMDTQIGSACARLLPGDVEGGVHSLSTFVAPTYELTRDMVSTVRSLLRVERSTKEDTAS
jgi:hypothetical protein